MTDPERDILDRLTTRVTALAASLEEDLALLGPVPADLAAFDALPAAQRTASRAVLKSFEQIEDQIARLFRVTASIMGEDTQGWYARDFADFMEKFGVLDDASAWSAVVRLRNQLVHDYPLDPQVQFERLLQAIAALPLLRATHDRLRAFVATRLS